MIYFHFRGTIRGLDEVFVIGNGRGYGERTSLPKPP